MNLSRLFHCSVINVLSAVLTARLLYHTVFYLSTTFLFFSVQVICDDFCHSCYNLTLFQMLVNSFFDFLFFFSIKILLAAITAANVILA